MYERLTKRLLGSNAPYTEFADYNEIIDRLCDLEDKIEQKKIMELPCAVGQTIYVLTTDSPTGIEETKISQVVFRLKGNCKMQYSILAPCVYDDWGKAKWSFCENNFGRDFFFDKAEAQNKLMELQKRTDKTATDFLTY